MHGLYLGEILQDDTKNKKVSVEIDSTHLRVSENGPDTLTTDFVLNLDSPSFGNMYVPDSTSFENRYYGDVQIVKHTKDSVVIPI